MDETRYEDVPIDELDEWLRNRINEQIADAFEGVARDAEDRYIEYALRKWARRLRSDRSRD